VARIWITGGTGLITLLTAVVLMALSAPPAASHQPRTTGVITTTAHITGEP
jgi:hypothetical protein